jgi:hypothetical protein
MVTAVIPEQVSWNVEVLPVSFSNGEFGFLCQKKEEFSIRIMNENMTITSNLVQGLRMSRTIPLLHIYAFLVDRGNSAWMFIFPANAWLFFVTSTPSRQT